eukprot:9036050-Alexandrium_andersonii.AAC.1
MSASLVGSEMCIRDRIKNIPESVGSASCGAGLPANDDGFIPNLDPGRGSVLLGNLLDTWCPLGSLLGPPLKLPSNTLEALLQAL